MTFLFDDKPGRFFTVIKSWMDETSGTSLGLSGGVRYYEIEDGEGRIQLLIYLPIANGGKLLVSLGKL